MWGSSSEALQSPNRWCDGIVGTGPVYAWGVRHNHPEYDTVPAMIDWSHCPDVERTPDKVSGRWLLRGTRVPVDDILLNARDLTPEQIVIDVYEGLDIEIVRRVIAYGRERANAPVAGS